MKILTDNLIRHRRIPRPTCIVSDSAGHQSASSGPAGESASGSPDSNRRPSILSLKPSVSSVLFVPFLTKITLPLRLQHCSSCTYSMGKRLGYEILLIMPNKPNFQPTRLTVTLDMLRTYNDNQPKKRGEKQTQNEQKTNKNRKKTNQNEPISAKNHPKDTRPR